MVDNGSSGSPYSVARLEANRKYTGYSAPLRKLRNHNMISALRESTFIGITTFRFPYGDAIIALNAPIVEKSDTSLIL